MKTLLTTGWHGMRIIRVIAGAAGIFFSLLNHDATLGIAAGLLLFMGIANVGCCGAGGCSIPTSSTKQTTEKDLNETAYEELS